MRIRASHLSAYELNHTGFHHYVITVITVTRAGISTCKWLVWLNRFTETGFEELLAFTLFVWKRFRLHVIAFSPSEKESDGPVLGGVVEGDANTLR